MLQNRVMRPQISTYYIVNYSLSFTDTYYTDAPVELNQQHS